MYNSSFNERIPVSLLSILSQKADAVAVIKGSQEYPQISGKVRFYQENAGTVVFAEVRGLPDAGLPCKEAIFAFHIHEGNVCTGNESDPFLDVGAHYDPKGCMHPYHAGDLPPLFANRKGLALSVFLTDRFSVQEIMGRTIIIHDMPDDFSTQPSGNAGQKIACGIIRQNNNLF